MTDSLRTRIAAAIGRNDCKDYHGTTDGSTCVFCVDWFLPKADAVIRELQLTVLGDGIGSAGPANGGDPSENRTNMNVITVKEAAEILSVSGMTIRRLINSGRLPAWRVAGDGPVRINRADAEALRVPVSPGGTCE